MLKQITATNQFILPPSPFDKNGDSAWPGTLEEASELLEVIHYYSNIKDIFNLIDFSPEILEKIEKWSFLDLCCSLYYFYFDITFHKRQKRGESAINIEVWIIAAAFLLNSEISAAFSKFIRERGIVTWSKDDDILNGITYRLNHTPIKKQNLCFKTSLLNL